VVRWSVGLRALPIDLMRHPASLEVRFRDFAAGRWREASNLPPACRSHYPTTRASTSRPPSVSCYWALALVLVAAPAANGQKRTQGSRAESQISVTAGTPLLAQCADRFLSGTHSTDDLPLFA
jgi:hypothetical protein